MKRSEMIKLIYNCMKDNHFGQYGEYGKMSEQILDLIEDNDMLPPTTDNKEDAVLIIPIYDNNYGALDHVCTEVRGWDKE